jgi:hypothetical protein
MSDPEIESGEGEIDEEGRNPTQQRLDEEGAEDVPVDAPWPEGGSGPDDGGPGSQNM